MPTLRTLQIRAAIATLLDQTDGWLYPETRLFADLNAVRLVSPPVTLAEFEEVLRKMELTRQILRFRNQEQGVKTKLTDEGKADLLS
jgi:hypothetical protein